MPDSPLGQASVSSAAKSGAFSTETAAPLTPEALAAALLALPRDDRARLAALLLSPPTGRPEEEAVRVAADAPQARQAAANG